MPKTTIRSTTERTQSVEFEIEEIEKLLGPAIAEKIFCLTSEDLKTMRTQVEFRWEAREGCVMGVTVRYKTITEETTDV